jgi:hypothetical protein
VVVTGGGVAVVVGGGAAVVVTGVAVAVVLAGVEDVWVVVVDFLFLWFFFLCAACFCWCVAVVEVFTAACFGLALCVVPELPQAARMTAATMDVTTVRFMGRMSLPVG